MVGGSQQAFDRVKPLFDLMGKNITLVGGERRRADHQGGEPDHRGPHHRGGRRGALSFASKAGADPAKVRQALDGRACHLAHPGGARRAHDQAHLRSGLPHRAAPKGPQSRAAGRARQIGVSLPNTATAQELFNACAAHGGSAWDHSAMVRALEIMANHEVGR